MMALSHKSHFFSIRCKKYPIFSPGRRRYPRGRRPIVNEAN